MTQIDAIDTLFSIFHFQNNLLSIFFSIVVGKNVFFIFLTKYLIYYNLVIKKIQNLSVIEINSAYEVNSQHL